MRLVRVRKEDDDKEEKNACEGIGRCCHGDITACYDINIWFLFLFFYQLLFSICVSEKSVRGFSSASSARLVYEARFYQVFTSLS